MPADANQLRGVDAERRAAGDEDAHAAAEGLAHLGVDELVGELPEQRCGLAAVVDDVAEVASRCSERPGEQALLDGR